MTSATREPQLEALMTFLAAARLGRYTAAAEVLGVNHSTVSRRIASLEDAMGGRVLVRTASGWEVTELGRRALGARLPQQLSLARRCLRFGHDRTPDSTTPRARWPERCAHGIRAQRSPMLGLLRSGGAL